MTPPDSQSGPIVRHATPADLPGIGRLGALLVEEHYGFDPRRFLAARPGTQEGYASFISTQLANYRQVISGCTNSTEYRVRFPDVHE